MDATPFLPFKRLHRTSWSPNNKVNIISMGFLSAGKLNCLKSNTLGPAYNEFAYYEHSATTNRFFFQKRRLLIDINIKKFRYKSTAYNEHIFMNEAARCKRHPVLLLRFGVSLIFDWGSQNFLKVHHSLPMLIIDWLPLATIYLVGGVPGPLTPLISDQLVLWTIVTSETQE